MNSVNRFELIITHTTILPSFTYVEDSLVFGQFYAMSKNQPSGPTVGVVVEVVCLYDLTLKVSGPYLNFWLSYKTSLIKWLTCQRESRVESRAE